MRVVIDRVDENARSASVRYRCASFGLLEKAHDLAVDESRCFYCECPGCGSSTFDHCGFERDYPATSSRVKS